MLQTGNLSLTDGDINGSIPSEIGLLGNLKRLDLWANALVGTIPSEIGLLSSIGEFFLDKCIYECPSSYLVGRKGMRAKVSCFCCCRILVVYTQSSFNWH